jgi:hypothetical protein
MRWYPHHPSSIGTFRALVGFGFAFGSWPGTTFMPALLLPAYLYRIHIKIKERALPAALGAGYVAYTRRTWRLVAGLCSTRLSKRAADSRHIIWYNPLRFAPGHLSTKLQE